MRRAPLLLTLWLCACGTETPPELKIRSLLPMEQTTADWQTLTLELEEDPPLLLDYGRNTAELGELPTLEIGPRTVALTRYLGRGRYEAVMEPGMEIGLYDIRVRTADGREAGLSQRYRVKPAINGYWIETIQDQLQDAPFTITIHVDGPDALVFDGSVTVSINEGQLIAPGNTRTSSFRTGPFSEGVRQEVVTIDTPANNLLIRVVDDEGESTSSNEFRVAPR
ncbi:MAG TPA: hypothetical protein VLQ93_05455 [Myxococcaceae bacterium]|nr:hypothetical protein [Myxococcaceae bacterium]